MVFDSKVEFVGFGQIIKRLKPNNIMKQEIIDFRKEIAALEVEQRNTKEQRKTVRFEGERTLSPLEAYWKAQSNSEKLRAMYAAYGLMRGKKFSQIENKAKLEDGRHPLFYYCSSINSYLEKYGYKMPYEEVQYKTWGGETKTRKEFNPETCEEIVRVGE